jgi:hypothetical protein
VPTDVELDLQRANTVAFIQASPTTIALQPVKRVQLPTGGFRDEPQPLRLAQVLRVIPLSDQNRPIITVDGKQFTAEVMLLGKHDATIVRRDRWSSDGQQYEVIEVQAGHRYETKALAVRRG